MTTARLARLRPSTLQRRVLVYLAAIAIASCALTVAVAIVLVRQHVASTRRDALAKQAANLALVGGPRAPRALAAGTHVYRFAAGRLRAARPAIARRVTAAIPAGDADGTIDDVAGHRVDYAARATDAGRVVLFRRADLPFSDWKPFLLSVGIAGGGGALLAALLSVVFARRLTRPIAALSRATGRLGAGETDVAVPVHGTDELSGLARSFNAMSGELARMRAGQRAFLESVGHELKTPLTSVRGYAEALEEHAVDPDEAARVISGEAGRLQRLVADLMDLARFERAGFDVRRAPVELGAIAVDAVARHRPRAAELGVALHARRGEDAWVTGDDERLLQATSNLVENALRLTPAGGEVTVTAAPGAIAVSDTGPGLADEDLPRAFERFYLYDRYRSERAVGTGLGLAIVAELVAAMGGRVTAANRAGPGSGAVFAITLPASSATPRSPAATGGPRPFA